MTNEKKITKKKTGLIALLIVLVVLCFVPQIVQVAYFLHLIIVTMIWVILTTGLNVIQGYAGYVSMCQVAFYGLGAYTSGLIMTKLGLPMGVGLLAAIGVGLIAGYLIGLPTLRTKGHYFSIVTLSFTMLLFTIFKGWYDVTGGVHGFALPLVEGQIFGYDLSSKEGYYYIVLIVLAITILFVYRLFKSKTGRAIVTIRENENLAKAIGINTVATKQLAFNISAVLGAVAGVLYAHYMNYVNPTSFTAGVGMNAILAVMMGGAGTVLGPVVGSAAVIFLPEILRAAEMYRQLVFGIILILIVFVMPNGVVEPIKAGFKKLFNKIKGKKDTMGEAPPKEKNAL